MMVLHIAALEMRRYFLSPLAWVILGVVQFLFAWIFLVQVDQFLAVQGRLAGMEGAPGVSDLVVAPLFGSASVILLMIVPLMAMRSIAEERRARTLPLLFSAPVSMGEIVLGKYLALVGFLWLLVGLLVLMCLSLSAGTELDLGKLAANATGLALMSAAFAAAGLFMSSLTRQPVVAAVAAFGLLLMLWIIDWAGQSGGAAQGSELFAYLSLTGHFQSFAKGVVDTRDLAYFLIFIGIFVALSVRRLDADRLQN